MTRPTVLRGTRHLDAVRIYEATAQQARGVGIDGELAALLTDTQLQEIAVLALDSLADSLGRGDRLAGYGIVSRLLDGRTTDAVAVSRTEGESWAAVAARIGVTKQAAHQRYRGVAADSPRTESASSQVRGGSMDYLEKA